MLNSETEAARAILQETGYTFAETQALNARQGTVLTLDDAENVARIIVMRQVCRAAEKQMAVQVERRADWTAIAAEWMFQSTAQ